MANEVVYQFQITLNNGELQDQYTSGSSGADQSTAKLVRNVQTIGFATHEALGLGDVTTPGYAVFKNLDDTNFVDVGLEVAATFYVFARLQPGEQGLVPLGASAIYAQADTADVELFYIIYDS
jgi:hypothetical protein